MKKNSFILLTIVLIFTISFCITETVKGQNSRKLSLHSQYEKEIEQQYVEDIKAALTDMGYEYAGVSLSKIVSQDNEKTYTLSIHHKRIDRMNEKDRKELIEELEQITLMDNEYEIVTKFLEYNC